MWLRRDMNSSNVEHNEQVLYNRIATSSVPRALIDHSRTFIISLYDILKHQKRSGGSTRWWWLVQKSRFPKPYPISLNVGGREAEIKAKLTVTASTSKSSPFEIYGPSNS